MCLFWAAQWGHEDHALGWGQAPVTEGQRRELPVAASISGVRLMQSMAKTMLLLNTKFPNFFLALVRRALQMWRWGQKQPVFPLFVHASQPVHGALAHLSGF